MPELLRTTKDGRGKKAHTHIAYINDAMGTGITTIDQDHAHTIEYRQAQEEVYEPPMELDGQPRLVQAAMEAGWFVAEANGHTHGLEEYVTSTGEEDEKDEDIVREVADMFFEAEALENDSRKRGYEAEDMLMNKQWDEGTMQKLDAEERAHTTVNKIEQKLDNLGGYQRQNRTDFKFLPTEGGDQTVADILTNLVKHITEQCSYPREESKAFDDAALVGRGLFNVYDDFTHNIEGDIVIEKFPWDEGYFGPHHKETLEDCDVCFKEKWWSERKLKQMYPEKFKEFSEELKLRPVQDSRSDDWDKRLRSTQFIDTIAKKYRMIERQMKTYKRAYILVNSTDDFVFDALGWKDSDVNAVRNTIPGFSRIERVTYHVRITKIVSDKLVEDEHLYEEVDFSLVPLYAKKRNDEWWGKVEGIKDLQRLINKTYSQFVDIINKVANYGWFYDAETFDTQLDEKKWKANAAKPGFNQKVKDSTKPPTKTEGVKFPQEMVNAIAMFNNDMREVMNVNLEMMGEQGSQQSGVAMRQKITQQLLGNDFLFDNLSFAKKKIGQIMVRKIQKLYTPERIMRILQNQDMKQVSAGEKPIELTMPNQQGMPQQTPLSAIDPNDIMKLLQTSDLSKYDVIVSESPYSPSAMMGNFLLLSELAGKGVQIPPRAILEFAPLPQKDKIIQMIEQEAMRQMEQEKMKYDTEIQKSVIAASSKQGGQMPGQQGLPQAQLPI